MIRSSVLLVSGYAHVFVLFSVVIVALPFDSYWLSGGCAVMIYRIPVTLPATTRRKCIVVFISSNDSIDKLETKAPEQCQQLFHKLHKRTFQFRILCYFLSPNYKERDFYVYWEWLSRNSSANGVDLSHNSSLVSRTVGRIGFSPGVQAPFIN